jgi:hypothetical protein
MLMILILNLEFISIKRGKSIEENQKRKIKRGKSKEENQKRKIK